MSLTIEATFVQLFWNASTSCLSILSKILGNGAILS